MTSVVVANVPQGHTPPDVPYKDNGDFYEYFMSPGDYRYLVYADHPGELLDFLIPGYLSMDEDEQILARITMALSVQSEAQGLVLAALSDEQRANVHPWEWDVLFHRPDGSQPHDWAQAAGEVVEEGSGESIDIWYSPVPLVLVDTAYAPFTDTPRPVSALGSSRLEKNLVWLEPSDEEEFLNSLSRVNYLYIARRLSE